MSDQIIGINKPLVGEVSKQFSKGFHITSPYPNRQQRRLVKNVPSGGNRMNNRARSTQLIQGNQINSKNELTIGKRIIHNILAIKLSLARMLPVWGKDRI